MADNHKTITVPQSQFEQLQQQHVTEQSLLDVMSEGMAVYTMVWDAAGVPIDYRLVDMNPAFAALTGLRRSEAIGRLASDLYSPDPPLFLEEFAHVAATGIPTTLMTTGAIPQKCLHISAFSTAPGQFATLWSDLTVQHQTAPPHRLESLYRCVADMVADYTFMLRIEPDGSSVIEWLSEGFTRVTGLMPAEAADPEIINRVVYAEDRPVVQQHQVRVLTDVVTDSVEFRIVCNDEIRWLRHHMHPVYDPVQQRVVRLYGAAQDITAQRQMEQELQLTRFALDHAPDGVAFLNEAGQHLYVNYALCRMLGYACDELQQLSVSDIDPELLPEIWQQIWHSTRSGDSVSIFEGIHRRKDGSRFPVEIAANYLEFRGKAYLCSFARDITERRAYQQQIETLAFSDPLTGLANRRCLYELGEDLLKTCAPGTLALLYLDLDRFKAFNDALGHDTGDALLVQVTRRLQQEIMESGLFARIGGDEFAVLLTDTCVEAAVLLAERLLQVLYRPFDFRGYTVHLSGSIGIAMGPVTGQPFSILLTRADIAMYRAKRSNAGVQVYDPDTNALSFEQVQLEAELRQALTSDGLTLHYQPLFDLMSESLFAVEALVRWPHPTRGLLYPDSFLPLAEEAGLLRVLDLWVLRTALRQAASWQAAGTPRTITVNLGSPSLQQANLVGIVADLLAETGVPAERLVIELTEHAALHDLPLTYQVLTGLQSLGVRIALDDFGTGYASLSHLRDLPVDMLKIERAFASGIGHNPRDEAVLRAVLALGIGLELMVVAEGVEQEDQLCWLRTVGCKLIQGYLISKPVPPEALPLADRPSPGV